jgi:hypothetical protein
MLLAGILFVLAFLVTLTLFVIGFPVVLSLQVAKASDYQNRKMPRRRK